MKNRLFVRVLCVMICAVMLMADVAAVGQEALKVLQLPEGLVEIRSEAFADTDGLEKVIVAEGTERIESRAFADSGAVEIHLPESVNYIADDAFEGCEAVVVSVHEGSYAHGWCILNDVEYAIAQDDETTEIPFYSSNRYISSVYGEIRTDENGVETFVAGCEHSAVEAGTSVTLQILGEDGEKVQESSTWYLSGTDEPDVYECGFGNLPEYFLIRAEMRKDGELLCEPYVCRKFTEAYKTFSSKSKEDYSQERVADFGDTGFAVLAEDVRMIEGESVDNGDGTYTVPATTDIRPGDKVILNISDTHVPVKVGAISAWDTYFILKAAQDLVLSDFYSVIHIDEYFGAENPEECNGNDEKIFIFTQAVEWDGIKISPTFDLGAHLRVDYDRDADYFDMEVYIETSGVLNVTVGNGVDTRTLPYNPLETILYYAPVVIPVANIPAGLFVSITPDLWAEVGGSAEFGYRNKYGFRTGENGNLVGINEDGQAIAKAEFKGIVGASIGPKVELDFNLFNLIACRIVGTVGVEATGEIEGISVDAFPDDKLSRHACASCLNLDASLFGYVEGALECPIRGGNATLAQLRILNGKAKFGDAFFSFVNDTDSVYQGQAMADFGECRNIQHRVKVNAADVSGNALTGIPITVTKTGGSSYSGSSPEEFYLYAGSHRAEAAFESGTGRAFFSVTEPCEVTIREPEVVLNVLVQDNDTEEPIAGAKVTLTMPDGVTQRTAITDAEGKCVFNALPGGTYSAMAEAGDYDVRFVNDLRYTAGTSNNLTINMLAGQLPLLNAFSSDGKVQALTEEGTCPESVTPIYLNVINGKYNIESIEVSMEGCETLVYEPNYLISSATLTALHMGNGEYTYVLRAWINGRIGGSEIIVFRARDGKFEILKSFDGTSRSDNIYVDAAFTSDTTCSGTILPTGRKFTIVREPDNLERSGCTLVSNWPGYFYYEEDENGYYDIQFATSEKCSYNADVIGMSYTRYIMLDDQLVIESQWFDGAGEVTYD